MAQNFIHYLIRFDCRQDINVKGNGQSTGQLHWVRLDGQTLDDKLGCLWGWTGAVLDAVGTKPHSRACPRCAALLEARLPNTNRFRVYRKKNNEREYNLTPSLSRNSNA